MSVPQPIDTEQMTRRSKRGKDVSTLEYDTPMKEEKYDEIVVQNDLEHKKKHEKT